MRRAFGGGSASGPAVPLARRLLLADPRRLLASVAGVGLALMLILLLDGLSTGIDERVTVYEERSGADLFVGGQGATSFLGSSSVLPRSALADVRAQPDVRWAAPVRGFFSVPQVRGARIPSFVVGWEPGQPGGPWSLASGRKPAADDEIVVGEQFAGRGAVSIGDRIEILGRRFDVVGIAADADMFMASFLFMTHQATDLLLGAPDTTSFVLIGTDRPGEVRRRLEASGLNAMARADIERNDLALKGQAYSTALNLMVAVSFVVGTLVITLTIYSAVVERRRDYGIVKAIGATGPRLFRLVVTQSLVLAAGGLLAGILLFAGGSAVLAQTRPQLAIALTSSSAARVGLAALVMGFAATVLPARRLAATEPASAFRGA